MRRIAIALAVAITVSGVSVSMDDGGDIAGLGTGADSSVIRNSGSSVTIHGSRPGSGGSIKSAAGTSHAGSGGSGSASASASGANREGLEGYVLPDSVSAAEAVATRGTDSCVASPTVRFTPCGTAAQATASAPPRQASRAPRTPTLTDIASFRPATPDLTVEPHSFGIVGRPTNFVVSARPQSLTGRLFDLPVTVQFSPTAYRFEYGDGTAKTTPTAGSTWKAGDAPLFTRTGTSHTYTRKALVTARATVFYSARVSFAGHPDWYDVAGYVTASTRGSRFQLYVAHTVLVEHTCDEDPHGPGCPAAQR